MNAFLRFLGRVCLSTMFIIGGYGAYTQPTGRHKALPNVGLPESENLVKINGATMMVAGTTLALGIVPKLSALTLLAALIPTTLAGHPFWKETEEAKQNTQRTNFLKNVGLAGGLLMVMSKSKRIKTVEISQED